MAVARDKFWVFGVRPHQDDQWINVNWQNQLPASRITPTEAAHILDVPNMLLINCDGEPVPFSTEAYGYAESFCRMNKVFWSAVGSAGFRIGNEPEFICKLAERYPNIGGAFLDDIFVVYGEKSESILKEIRKGLDKAPRHLEMYVTWYPHVELGKRVNRLINQYIDGVSMWTGNSDDLIKLESVFEEVENTFPDKKKFLGIYLYDYQKRRPLTDEQMEHQCGLGLKWLKEGRLDGMIFLGNSLMGLRFPSEMWLRDWVDKVKYTEIPE